MLIVLFLSPFLVGLVSGFTFTSRDIPGNSTSQTFDYVVVGCGIAGLVVAARLSEDPDVSVACIEVGSLYVHPDRDPGDRTHQDRDNYENSIEFPVYIGHRPPEYEWDITTLPQTQLDGNSRTLVLGRGVGGGGLINGMLWNRGSQNDFNNWGALGNAGWDWESMLPYVVKSETYTPRYYDGIQNQPVTCNESVHGTSGPVNVSYPQYFWPQTSKSRHRSDCSHHSSLSPVKILSY